MTDCKKLRIITYKLANVHDVPGPPGQLGQSSIWTWLILGDRNNLQINLCFFQWNAGHLWEQYQMQLQHEHLLLGFGNIQ